MAGSVTRDELAILSLTAFCTFVKAAALSSSLIGWSDGLSTGTSTSILAFAVDPVGAPLRRRAGSGPPDGGMYSVKVNSLTTVPLGKRA